MGTPEFAIPTLRELVEDDEYNPLAVITQPDRRSGRGQRMTPPPIKKEALKLGLEVIQEEQINNLHLFDLLQRLEPQVMVVVAFGQLLSKRLLQLPFYGCINLHASLLPRYRGAAPLHRVIINGESETGVTTMLMNEGMDTGDILLQDRVSIGEDETVGELHDRLALRGGELMLKTLLALKRGELQPEPQEEERASYAPPLDKEECCLNWEQSASELHNLIRGTNPWPGAYTYHRQRMIKVWSSTLIEASGSDSLPGTVLGLEEEGLRVATGSGVLSLQEIQPAGKGRMSCRDYCCGYSLKAGDKLGRGEQG